MRHLLNGIGILCLLGLIGLTGCASIVHGGPDSVKFTSDPTGATVTIDGVSVGQTPVIAQVARKSKSVTYTLSDYDQASAPLDRKLNPWIFGNIVFGGIIGLVVDMATNNHMEANGEMHINLHKTKAEMQPPAKGALAGLRQRIHTWRDQLGATIAARS